MIVSPSPPSPSASASEIPVVSPPAASPSPSGSPALEVFPPNTVYDGCLLIEPTGNTTLIAIAFTLANPQTGEYRAVFGQSPGGSLSGVGPARVGQNPIVIPMRATAFGTYDHLSITGPDGSPPALGPLTSQFPFQLNAATDKPNDCNPSTLKSPPSQALAAQQYLDAVAPVNAAASAFIAKVQTWTDATTSAAAGEDAAPLLAAFQTVDGQLQDLAGVYPPAADALVTDHQMVQRLISDLSNLAQLDAIGVAAWRQQFLADGAAGGGVERRTGSPRPAGHQRKRRVIAAVSRGRGRTVDGHSP